MAKSKKEVQAAQARFKGVKKDSTNEPKLYFTDVDANELAFAVASVVSAGDAVVLGRSRDGGALCITILAGDDKTRLWSASAFELSENVALVKREYTDQHDKVRHHGEDVG